MLNIPQYQELVGQPLALVELLNCNLFPTYLKWLTRKLSKNEVLYFLFNISET